MYVGFSCHQPNEMYVHPYGQEEIKRVSLGFAFSIILKYALRVSQCVFKYLLVDSDGRLILKVLVIHVFLHLIDNC